MVSKHLDIWIGSLATCGVIALVGYITNLGFENPSHILFYASTAATTLLVFTVPHGSFSQPWPVVGGQMLAMCISAVSAGYLGVGIVVAALAVGLTIATMSYLGCLHPPAGATAFFFVSSYDQIDLVEVSLSLTINIVAIVMLAIIINGIFHWRKYPLYWFRADA